LALEEIILIPEIALVTAPQVDWPTLCKNFTELVGHSPTRSLDRVGWTISDPQALIPVLTSFSEYGCDAHESLREPRRAWDHMFFSFLIHCDKEILTELLGSADLRVLHTITSKGDSLLYVSGSLTQWFTSTLVFCTEGCSKDLRFIFDSVVLNLEKKGFKDIWLPYRKTFIKDKTFLLEEK
jgi:hypothetical protein